MVTAVIGSPERGGGANATHLCVKERNDRGLQTMKFQKQNPKRKKQIRCSQEGNGLKSKATVSEGTDWKSKSTPAVTASRHRCHRRERNTDVRCCSFA